MSAVQRFDTARLSKYKKTAQGFLRGPANLTRVGVLLYTNADGSTQRELRLPEEVFNKDSLETLATAPLTDLHSGYVTPSTVSDLEIGSLHGDPKADGDFVSAEVLIKKDTAIKAVEDGSRAELSCGYTCNLEMKSGSWRGERYDAIQRNIRYNHVALGPRNWGRAGSEVALRTDSADALAEIGESTEVSVGKERMDEVEFKVDGITVKVPKLAAELFAKEMARKDSKIGELENKLGAAETAAKEAKTRADAAGDPKTVQARVDARCALLVSAGKFLGDEKLDGLSDREIQVKALVKADSKFSDEGKSDDYIAGAFGALKVADADAEKSRADAAAAALAAKGSDKTGETKTRADAVKAKQNLWKGAAKKEEAK